jgi:hypothetical protein
MERKGRQTAWISVTLLLAAGLAFLPGCGRKGDPIAPEDYPSKKDHRVRNPEGEKPDPGPAGQGGDH